MWHTTGNILHVDDREVNGAFWSCAVQQPLQLQLSCTKFLKKKNPRGSSKAVFIYKVEVT